VERRREIYFLDGVPQVGTRYYGIVDQGTNVVEVRPTSLCPLNCVFCSVAAGPLEGRRWADFTVKKDALVDALKAVVRYKGDGVEVHIDGMGRARRLQRPGRLSPRREVDQGGVGGVDAEPHVHP
jgi:Predicted Fe-S oxidoreductase